MTTKQRAYLKGLAMTMDPIFQIGKASMNPGLTQAVSEALDAREQEQWPEQLHGRSERTG